MPSDLQLTDAVAARADAQPQDAQPQDARPEEVVSAFTEPPVWDKRMLEIGLVWPGRTEAHEWAAGRLRVFLLTWDPFEWQADRPAAFATSTRRVDGVGLVLYLPYWQALALADGEVANLPAVLGQLGESVLSVAADHQAALSAGTYPEGVQAASLPALLSRVPDRSELGTPELSVIGAGWQPIQFDVLEDLAQEAFGPADLDRSPVRFTSHGEAPGTCPACTGQAVDFPDGLKDAQETICGPHRAEALRITTARLEAAQASNPTGWEALLEAGQRLAEPHLPNGLGPRLLAASQIAAPKTSQLLEQAALVEAAAALMHGLPDPETTLGARLAPVRPWLQQLPDTLATAGLVTQAAGVAMAADELLTTPEAALSAAQAAAEAVEPKPQPYRRDVRVGRNALCPCGSGKKYKFCHGR